MVTADPLTLSLRFAATWVKYQSSVIFCQRKAVIYPLFQLLMHIRSPAQTKKSPPQWWAGGAS